MEPVLLIPSATAPARPDGRSLRTTAPAHPTWAVALALSSALGVLLGVIAALADAEGGWLADALSMPGPWLAAAALVAAATDRRRPRALTSSLATAAFLAFGVAAYYVVKQATLGAAPGPLVVFWGALAVAVGAALGLGVHVVLRRGWGPAALAGLIAGWLVVETLAAPAAPTGEAVAGLLGVGVASRQQAAGSRTWWLAAGAGAGIGAAGAAVVFAVLSRVLSAVL